MFYNVCWGPSEHLRWVTVNSNSAYCSGFKAAFSLIDWCLKANVTLISYDYIRLNPSVLSGFLRVLILDDFDPTQISLN